MGFLSITSMAHHLVGERTAPGDTAIDATIGNGVDTLFLARLVGEKGFVYGFDIQADALHRTRARLTASGIADERYHLFLESHHRMEERIPTDSRGRIAAVMFNLGYLPGTDQNTGMGIGRPVEQNSGGNVERNSNRHVGQKDVRNDLQDDVRKDGRNDVPHTVQTHESTTIPALASALLLLQKRGLLTIVVYPGHSGGEREANTVLQWAEGLPGHDYQVLTYRMINKKTPPPYLIAIQKGR